MSVLLSLVVFFSAAGSATLSGVTYGPSGAPLAGARVFVEPGLGRSILSTETDPDGSYAFHGLPHGLAGVFAVAPGHGFAGRSVDVRPEEDLTGIDINLAPSGTIEGRVRDYQGDPVAGAAITRVLLIRGEDKVSIPLSKLTEWGFAAPATDSRGRFQAGRLPMNAEAALKVSHPDYAQATASGVSVGDDRVRVTMQPGVLLQGSVTSREKAVPVADAVIIIQNAQPPYNTVLTKTDAHGEYAVRLEPGYYVYHAATSASRSPGARQIRVGGQGLNQRADLAVAGRTRLRGEVRDAASGEPVAGAKVRLYAHGNPAGVSTTQSQGAYVFDSTEGENVVRLQSAPGYLPPERNAISLEAAEGEVVELPAFWLKPMPAFHVRAVDEAGAPVEGACVSVVRPPRFGWDLTAADGRAAISLRSIPGDGVIAGVVEHPRLPHGAVFALDAREETEVTATLAPWAELRGHVTNSEGDSLEGAIVTGLADLPQVEEPPPLWRCVSGPEGRFQWPYAPADVPQRCRAATAAGDTGASLGVTPAPGSAQDVGRVVIPGGESERALSGRSLDLAAYARVSGPPLDSSRPYLVMFCSPAEAPGVAEWMGVARSLAGLDGLGYAVAATGRVEALEGITLLRGSAPSAATTYLLTPDGTVALECLGIPPVAALRRLQEGGDAS